MSDYRRWFVPGGTFFFTVVTYQRRPILTGAAARRCLREAFRETQGKWPWTMVAIVLLPDHLHAIWTLPPGDSRYSIRWQKVKETFTRKYLASGGYEGRGSLSRKRHGKRAVWQRRFWEHTCRDEEDMRLCADYLHWNPVKHAMARSPLAYRWSSFHRFVRLGEYPVDWGRADPCSGLEMPE